MQPRLLRWGKNTENEKGFKDKRKKQQSLFAAKTFHYGQNAISHSDCIENSASHWTVLRWGRPPFSAEMC